MRTDARIHKVYKKIIDRFSGKYNVGIKTYSTVYNLLRGYVRSKDTRRNYKQTIRWYDMYLKNAKKGKRKDYIDTKYDKVTKRDVRHEAFKITALSTEPISLVVKSFKRKPDSTIAYYILHELGHIKMNIFNEYKCDLFAIRWVRQLIKEGIIK